MALFNRDVREPAEQVQPGWMEQFRKQFSSPEARAALLQFGVSALQPVGFGQTLGGHLGQALGAGAEAVGRGAQRREAEEQRMFERGQTERRTGALEARVRRGGRQAGGLVTRSQQLTHQRAIAGMVERARRARLDLVLDDEERARLAGDPDFNAQIEAEVRSVLQQAGKLGGVMAGSAARAITGGEDEEVTVEEEDEELRRRGVI